MRLKRKPSENTSAKLTSYYRSSKINDSLKQGRGNGVITKLQHIFKNVLRVVFVLIFVTAVINWGFMLKPQAKIVVSSGDPYKASASYLEVIKPLLGSIKDHNKISFDSDKISKTLITRFPEINSVQVELPVIGKTPIIRVEVSEPVFRLLDSKDQLYVINASGRLVAYDTTLSTEKSLVLIQDHSGISSPIGTQIFSHQQINFIKLILAQAKYGKINVSYLAIPTQPQEIDLYTKQAHPYFVKFYINGDPIEQVGQFLAAQHKFAKSKSYPSQYLDVRVAGKIFYK